MKSLWNHGPTPYAYYQRIPPPWVYTGVFIRDFWWKGSVLPKKDNLIDTAAGILCASIWNKIATRRMVVFDPLKAVITNYNDGFEMLTGITILKMRKRPRYPLSRELGNTERKILWKIRLKIIFQAGTWSDGTPSERLIIRCDNV